MGISFIRSCNDFSYTLELDENPRRMNDGLLKVVVHNNREPIMMADEPNSFMSLKIGLSTLLEHQIF